MSNLTNEIKTTIKTREVLEDKILASGGNPKDNAEWHRLLTRENELQDRRERMEREAS